MEFASTELAVSVYGWSSVDLELFVSLGSNSHLSQWLSPSRLTTAANISQHCFAI